MRTWLLDLKVGDNFTFPVRNGSTTMATGTVVAAPRRRDRSMYYYIDVELESGTTATIQRHKNNTFTVNA